MINPPASQFPLQPVSWSEIARLCRRVCLLRECGQPVEAEQVRQGPLAEALAAMRATGASEPLISQQLESIFAAEAERVANASVLAELLRPMLAQQLAGGTLASASPLIDSTPPMPVAAPFAATPTPAPTPAAAKPDTPRASPMDIASFIDDMLAQERTDPPVRRVS